MADVRLNELPVLAAPTDGDILHALDDADDRDKQLTMAAVRTFAQVGTATAAQGALAATALQPGSVNLGTAATASTRTVTNTAGTPAVLPTFNTAAGLVPGTASGTTNFLRADGTWAAPPAGGGGGVSAVSGTVPIDVATGTTTPVVSIRAATTSAPGSMSGTDKTRLDGMQTGATANSTDAQLRDRSTHTGTQAASTISDFTASSRAQVEATLVAGANVTLTPSGSGATRTIAIASTAAGGGGGTVTNVTGTAPIQVASGTTTPAVSITAATTSAAGSMSGADKTKLDGIAPNATANSTDAQLRDRSTHTGTQLAATISLSGASLVGRSSAGVAQEITLGTNLSFSGTVLNATAGGGGVSTVTGTAPIVSSGGGSPAISIVPATTSVPGSMSAADKTKLDTLTAGANGTVTGVTGTAPIVSSGGAAPAISINPASGSAPGSMSSADFTKLAGVATGATLSNLGYTAATRTVTNSGGTSAVLPLFGTDAGLVPGTASSTTNFLRADGTWAAPPAGGGGVAQVTATAPLVVSGTATNPDIGILLAAFSLLGRATGTTGVPSALTLGAGLWFSGSTVAVNRTVIDTWYAATIGRGTVTLGSTAIASGANAAVVTVAAAGVATTDVIDWGFNGNPNVVTGYSAASTTGCLVITAYPTAGNVNFVVSNPTAASITPGSLTLNWRVAR